MKKLEKNKMLEKSYEARKKNTLLFIDRINNMIERDSSRGDVYCYVRYPEVPFNHQYVVNYYVECGFKVKMMESDDYIKIDWSDDD